MQNTTEQSCRYLISKGGQADEFGEWLKKLGISELPYGLTLSDFVNEGWIQPVLRINMPESYYLTWKDYPELSGEFDPIPEEDKWSYYSDSGKLWNPFFEQDDKEWFLHPYDRTEGAAKDFVKHAVNISKELPPEIKHPNGHIIRPYLWYFTHWQGYMFIDLFPRIIFCDCIPDTQNAMDKLENLKEKYCRERGNNRTNRDGVIKKWENYKITFTWLSYYRTMCGIAHSRLTSDRELAGRLIKQGAKELAKYLNIDNTKFEENFQNHLLVLFQDWKQRIESGDVFCKNALAELRKDISLALDWLCLLTGKDYETYFNKWSYQSLNQMEWAELKTVLPYESIAIKEDFLLLAPRYLEDFNKYLPATKQINKTKLEDLYYELWKNYNSFRPFCRSFHNLHKLRKSEEVIDFRSNAFIDFFLVFTLRAEVIIFEILKKDVESQKSLVLIEILNKYKDFFNTHNDLYQGICYIDKNSWKMTGLHDFPESPFKRVKDKINKEDKLSEISKQFASHLLNFGIARNYFAHHSYLDDKMTRGENARLALVSPLVSVLFLSAAKLGIL